MMLSMRFRSCSLIRVFSAAAILIVAALPLPAAGDSIQVIVPDSYKAKARTFFAAAEKHIKSEFSKNVSFALETGDDATLPERFRQFNWSLAVVTLETLDRLLPRGQNPARVFDMPLAYGSNGDLIGLQKGNLGTSILDGFEKFGFFGIDYLNKGVRRQFFSPHMLQYFPQLNGKVIALTSADDGSPFAEVVGARAKAVAKESALQLLYAGDVVSIDVLAGDPLTWPQLGEKDKDRVGLSRPTDQDVAVIVANLGLWDAKPYPIRRMLSDGIRLAANENNKELIQNEMNLSQLVNPYRAAKIHGIFSAVIAASSLKDPNLARAEEISLRTKWISTQPENFRALYYDTLLALTFANSRTCYAIAAVTSPNNIACRSDEAPILIKSTSSFGGAAESSKGAEIRDTMFRLGEEFVKIQELNERARELSPLPVSPKKNN